MKYTITNGYCDLCVIPAIKKKRQEGVEIKVWWFIKLFICESCLSKIFRRLTSNA